MSDEQLGETSISQGHGTFGICDGVCMFMREREESDFEISNQNQCLQLFGLAALVQWEREKKYRTYINSDTAHRYSDIPTQEDTRITPQPAIYISVDTFM